jgi:hypothetical protein
MAARFKFTALHNGEPIGVIRDGAVEVSRARNDEAIFWYGMAARRRVLPVSPAAYRILTEAFRRSASPAGASSTPKG